MTPKSFTLLRAPFQAFRRGLIPPGNNAWTNSRERQLSTITNRYYCSTSPSQFSSSSPSYSSSSSAKNTTNTTSTTRSELDPTHPIFQLPYQFPEFDFSKNSYELHRHGKGESHHPSQPPALIVHCKNTEQVQAVVRYCLKYSIPMIPFGGGTSLEAHVAAVQPYTLSIDLAKHMTNIYSIPNMNRAEPGDNSDALAVVDAGVTRSHLVKALKSTGFTFTVDPGASEATIGGMVSTAASGTTTVRYGTMKENILQLTAVLATTPDAPIVQLGTRAIKNSAGYDLLSLLCGSEGTLGIITKVTVKLHPIPQYVAAVTCNFDSLHEAAQAVCSLQMYGIDLMRCELLDATSIKAFNKYSGSDLLALPTLFLELSAATELSLEDQVNLVKEILGYSDEENEPWDKREISCAFNFHTAYQEQERAELWKARHGLYYASIQCRPGCEGAVVTDACVPLSKLADLIVATSKDVEELGVVVPCFGHAGDGNFHCILPTLKEEDDAYWNKIQTIKNNLITRTLEAGGTCTGEHGIGLDKKEHLKQQYTKETIGMMKVIKRALDPNNLLNPGKVVDS